MPALFFVFKPDLCQNTALHIALLMVHTIFLTYNIVLLVLHCTSRTSNCTSVYECLKLRGCKQKQLQGTGLEAGQKSAGAEDKVTEDKVWVHHYHGFEANPLSLRFHSLADRYAWEFFFKTIVHCMAFESWPAGLGETISGF